MAPLPDRIRGALLGLALGDALGRPVDGMSHQNVRTHYKGIKGLRADEKRGGEAGSGTAHTERAFALVRLLARLGSAPDHPGSTGLAEGLAAELGGSRAAALADAPWGGRALAPTCAAPLGTWAHATGATDDRLADVLHAALWRHTTDTAAIASALGMARGVALALSDDSRDGRALFDGVRAAVAWFEENAGMGTPVSDRLAALAPHLDEFPLDLQDRCGGTGDRAEEAFPFALAMFVREPELVEATLLSAVNVGGAASAVGAMAGSLLGARNGWAAFPAEWRAGLAGMERHAAETAALAAALGGVE